MSSGSIVTIQVDGIFRPEPALCEDPENCSRWTAVAYRETGRGRDRRVHRHVHTDTLRGRDFIRYWRSEADCQRWCDLLNASSSPRKWG